MGKTHHFQTTKKVSLINGGIQMNKQKEFKAAEINKDLIESQAADLRKAADKLKEAAQAYLSDLDTRKAALANQAADYQAQLDKATTQREALAAKIADYTSRGQIDEAAEADAELEALDKHISTLSRKLRLVQRAELKGDPMLYKAAKAAQDAVFAERTKYAETVKAFRTTVREEQDRLEKLERELRYVYPEAVGSSADDVFAKVQRHYLDLDRKAQEAKEKAATDREAAEREARITRIG